MKIKMLSAFAVGGTVFALGVAVLAPPAFADPLQNDAISLTTIAPGSPTVNGCPTSTFLVSVAANSAHYGAPARVDANGDGLVCAKPLPDAERDAWIAAGRIPAFFSDQALYDFTDDVLPAEQA